MDITFVLDNLLSFVNGLDITLGSSGLFDALGSGSAGA